MQYILTQKELDELKTGPNLVKVFIKVFELVSVKTVCIDVNVGSEQVVLLKDLKASIDKTIKFYDKQNP